MNMAYCRFQNTLAALLECSAALADLSGPRPLEALSDDEEKAARRLLTLCGDMATTYGVQA